MFTDIKLEHLKKIVRYLYTGKIQIGANEIEEFLCVAKKLKILGLHGNIDLETDKGTDRSETPPSEILPRTLHNLHTNGNGNVTAELKNEHILKRKLDLNQNEDLHELNNSDQSLYHQQSDDQKRAHTINNSMTNGLNDIIVEENEEIASKMTTRNGNSKQIHILSFMQLLNILFMFFEIETYEIV